MIIDNNRDPRVLRVEELEMFSTAALSTSHDRIMKQNTVLANMLGELCERLRKVELMLEKTCQR